MLVVDDNPDDRAVLTRRLTRRGFTTIEAESGEKALEILGEQQVDMVLLDGVMPGMGGIDVLTELRKIASASELPIVMVTGKSFDTDIQEAFARGASDYVTKPIDFAIVLSSIEALLMRRG